MGAQGSTAGSHPVGASRVGDAEAGVRTAVSAIKQKIVETDADYLGQLRQLSSDPSAEVTPQTNASGELADGSGGREKCDFAMSRHRSYGDISEAESERSAASFVSLKRSFSQTSVAPSSSRLTTSGTATPVTATRTPDEKEADLAAVRVSRSGTWPLRRQKSAAGAQELGNQLDLWDMQDTLQRERVELATQLAKLTGVGTGSRRALKGEWTAAGTGAAATRGPGSPLRHCGSFGDDSLRDEHWMDDLKHLVEQAADTPEEDGGDLMLDKILNVLQHGGNGEDVAAADAPTCHEYRSAMPHHAGRGGEGAPAEADFKSWCRPPMLATSRRASDSYEDAAAYSPAGPPSADGRYHNYSTASNPGTLPIAPATVLSQPLLPVPEGKCAAVSGLMDNAPHEPRMSRAVAMPDSHPATPCGPGAPVASSEEVMDKALSARPKEYKCKRCGAPKKGHICSQERDAEHEGSRREWSLQEDAHILNSVADHGCRWRVIAASMHGRSDDAVRNRWNRLKDRIGVDGQPLDLGGEGPGGKAQAGYSREGEPEDSPHMRVVDMPCPGDRCPSSQAGVGGNHNASESGHMGLDCARGGRTDIRMSSATFPPHNLAPLPNAAMLMSIMLPNGNVHSPRDCHGGERRKTDRVGWSPREDAIIANSVAELGHRWYFIAERLPGRTDHAIRNRWHRLQSMREDVQQRRFAQGDHELKQEEKLQHHMMPEHGQQIHYDGHLHMIDGGQPHFPLMPGRMDAPPPQAYGAWRQ